MNMAPSLSYPYYGTPFLGQPHYLQPLPSHPQFPQNPILAKPLQDSIILDLGKMNISGNSQNVENMENIQPAEQPHSSTLNNSTVTVNQSMNVSPNMDLNVSHAGKGGARRLTPDSGTSTPTIHGGIQKPSQLRNNPEYRSMRDKNNASARNSRRKKNAFEENIITEVTLMTRRVDALKMKVEQADRQLNAYKMMEAEHY